MTIVIKTNALQATDVLVRDIGIFIPGSGGSLVLSSDDEISEAKDSDYLLDLATDNAFGAGSSTLIINDGTSDIPQSNVPEFLGVVTSPIGDGNNSLNDLSDVDTASQTGNVSDKLNWDGSNWVRIKNNISTSDPEPTDDSNADYEVGSRWFNTDTKTEFVCLDATPAAAIWELTTSVGGTGASLGGEWKFDDSTSMSNPGSGEFRLNNSTQPSATQLAISENNEDDVDFANIISALSTGDVIYIQEKKDARRFVLCELTSSPVDNGSWQQIAISVLDNGTNPLRDGKECAIAFFFISSSGGITEPEHEDLDTIAHNIVETSFDEVTYDSIGRPTNYTIYTDVTKTTKIRECILTYTGSRVTQFDEIQYNAAGTETYRIVEVPTYDGATTRILSITRTRI